MKYKKLLIVSIFLLAILSLGAVSASSDTDILGNATYSHDEGYQVADAENEIAVVTPGDEGVDTENPDESPLIQVTAPNGTDASVEVVNQNDDSILFSKDLDKFDEENIVSGIFDEENTTTYNIFYSDLTGIEDLEDGDLIQVYFSYLDDEGQVAYEKNTLIFYDDGEGTIAFNPYSDEENSNAEFRIGEFVSPEDDENKTIAYLVVPEGIMGSMDIFWESSKSNYDYIVENLAIDDSYPYSFETSDNETYYSIPYNLFEELDDGTVVNFAFYEESGLSKEDSFRFVIDEDGTAYFDYLADNEPYIWVIDEIDLSDDDEVNHAFSYVSIPYDSESESPLYEGTFTIFVDGDEIFTQSIDDFDVDDETRVYPNYNYDDYMCYAVTLEDVNNFEGTEDGALVSFVFYDIDSEEVTRADRKIYFDEDCITFEENGDVDENDFEIETEKGNIALDDVVLMIHESELENLSIQDYDNEFTITADLWGNEKETQWNFTNISDRYVEEDAYYYWKISDLGIDELMKDIVNYADIYITVKLYQNGSCIYESSNDTYVYANPYITSGEISLAEDYAVIQFNYPLEEDEINDEFKVIIKKDGEDFTNCTFDFQDLNYYEDEDTGEIYSWYISQDELGINETGEYDIAIQFTDYDDNLIECTGSFTVVPFSVRIYPEDGDNLTDVMSPIFNIDVEENSTGNATVYVNGTKAFEEQFADMIYDEFHRGGGYFIKLNDLNITESGLYNITLVVENEGVSRTFEVNVDVFVNENSFEFRNILYLDGYFVEAEIGTPISSPLILYINGTKAGEGTISDGIRWNLTSDESFVDEYGYLKPGTYDAKIIVDNQTVAEDSFSVLDDSGNIIVEIKETYAADEPLTINITGTDQKGYLGDYLLLIYVDPVYNDAGFFDEDDMIELSGDDLEDIWDDVHEEVFWPLDEGTHTVLIKYYADFDDLNGTDYLIKFYTFNVTSDSLIETTLVAENITADYGSGENFTATLKDYNGTAISNATIIVKFNQTDSTHITDSSGKIMVPTDGLAPGNYSIPIRYDGDDAYMNSSTTANVVITDLSRVNTTLVAENITADYGNGDNFTATLKDYNGTAIVNASVIVQLADSNATYTTDDEGKITVSTSGLTPGNYTVTVNFNGDSVYRPSSTTANVVITDFNRINSTLVAENITTDYNSGDNFTATLKDLNGTAIVNASVIVQLADSNATYTTDDEGKITVSTSGLTPGNYTVPIKFDGDSVYRPSSTNANVVVNKVASNIAASNLNTYYNSGKYLLVILRDEEGNPIGNATVSIVMGNVTYNISTEANGRARLYVNTSVKPVSTVAQVIFEGNDIYTASNTTSNVVITKATTKLALSSFTTTYQSGNYLLGILTDGEGNYVQNATVAIALNNVMYRLTTDANGRVRQSINVLPVGTYSVKAAFYGNDGYEKSNQAAARIIVNKANAIINATSLTTTYNSGDNLVATLTGLNGKPISNARLVFKVNGKQSIVVTDSNGQANFSTAGLAPNKYSVVIGYPGNSAYDVVYYTTSLEIKKATPKIIAFNKTFAVKDTKTYPIALKDDKDVKIYSGSLTLKIYGKTYTLTVTRGIASFNVPISRIGTYNAVITYAGNSYYEAVSLNTKITITN